MICTSLWLQCARPLRELDHPAAYAREALQRKSRFRKTVPWGAPGEPLLACSQAAWVVNALRTSWICLRRRHVGVLHSIATRSSAPFTLCSAE